MLVMLVLYFVLMFRGHSELKIGTKNIIGGCFENYRQVSPPLLVVLQKVVPLDEV